MIGFKIILKKNQNIEKTKATIRLKDIEIIFGLNTEDAGRLLGGTKENIIGDGNE